MEFLLIFWQTLDITGEIKSGKGFINSYLRTLENNAVIMCITMVNSLDAAEYQCFGPYRGRKRYT